MFLVLKLFIVFFVALYFFVCKASVKNGIVLFWLSLFLLPNLIFSAHIIPFVRLHPLMILITTVFVFLDRNLWNGLKSFIKTYSKPLFFLLALYLALILFSEKVPLRSQVSNLLVEFSQIVIVIETLVMIKSDNRVIQRLYVSLSVILICNFAYSFICEAFLRTNFAGMPLYLLMGQENQEFLVDMIEVQRGENQFRLQSTYGHPLSLGQYYLLMLPLFLDRNAKVNRFVRWTILVCLVLSIYLSGTRGATFPMFVILLAYLLKHNISRLSWCKYVLIFPVILMVVYIALPFNLQREIDKKWDDLTTYVRFWDDKKQSEKGMGGSTMAMRFEQLDAALYEIRNNPLWGEGRGYREYYQKTRNHLHPRLLGYESFVLIKLVEQGWVGLCLFVLFTVYLYHVFRKYHTNVFLLQLLFFAYLMSTLMTGIRPYSFMILCFSGGILAFNRN